jgi:uncharacterized protein
MTFLACIGSYRSKRLDLRRFISPLFCSFALTIPALAIPVTASAQVRLGPEATGGTYTVKVMSWADIPFRSIVRQRYDFSCGSAAVATLLTYHYGKPTSEQQSFAQMWKAGDKPVITKSGFSMFDMKNYLQSIGLHSEGYRMSINDLRKGKRPAIVLLDINGYKHFVVVKGVIGDTVLVGDPIRGLMQYKAPDFKKSWNGIALAIVDGATRDRPDYNLLREWTPWSLAPVRDNSQVATIGDITTHLPTTYQLTPQIIIPARIGTGKE